jgi:anti-sigma-K factor RskA
MTDKRDESEDRSALAAEHALRLLDGDELREAKARVEADPEFAAEAARWRGRLAPLADEVDEVAPPDALWERIDSSLGKQGAAANDNVGALKRRLTVWRSATGAMAALAACLALLLAFEPRQTVVQPPLPHAAAAPMVAMLGDDKTMKVVASWDPGKRQLVLAVAGDMPADPAHAHELWVIPPGGKPRSLGTMGSAKQMHMTLADTIAALLQKGATIAISVEPPGGSPTGAPTGPVVASGALTQA